MKKICQTCDHSFMGFGESSCNYHLRCDHKDESVREDFTCNKWRNNYSKIIELEQKLSDSEAELAKMRDIAEETQRRLDETIEIIEFYADITNWNSVEGIDAFIDGVIIEEDVYSPCSDNGISVGGKRARDFLAKIEGVTPSK